jgi:hypothetical protein
MQNNSATNTSSVVTRDARHDARYLRKSSRRRVTEMKTAAHRANRRDVHRTLSELCDESRHEPYIDHEIDELVRDLEPILDPKPRHRVTGSDVI